ncbi:MAG: UDP-N-acetylmuramoyl-L-alanyl-D-glutamate--2,6-diaminopimelate ligase [Pseudomonadota bacterium]
MKLSDLTDLPVSQDAEVTGLTLDSRAVEPGMLFAALPGEKVDGAAFVASAVEAGASAVLAKTGAVTGVPVPLVEVDNPRLELARMAARFYESQPATMAAVTGTAGKTSVASFLRQIWAATDQSATMIGTTGVFAPGRADYGSLTTPDTVKLHALLSELAHEGVTHGAMEASSHGLDQYRLHGVKLAVAGFTNLGRDHMDYHPTVEDYLAAKMRLFEDLLEPGQPAVIYADDAYSEAAIATATQRGLDVKTVGRGGAYLALKRVEQHRFTQIGEVEFNGSIHRITLPMAGEFQMANALVAAGMAIATGSDAEGVFKALERLEGAPGRLEQVGETKHGAPVYVDYAHKPEALENVLTALKPYTTGHLWLVFGCGGDRDKGKRPIMGEIAGRLADKVIVTDDNPRSEDAATVRSEILAACAGAQEIGDRAEAIRYAIAQMGQGDSLIIAGKGHEEGQIVGDVTLPFSDHAVAREALK